MKSFVTLLKSKKGKMGLLFFMYELTSENFARHYILALHVKHFFSALTKVDERKVPLSFGILEARIH